jgi:hypothetical protein
MLEILARVVLGGVLLVAAAAKLRRFDEAALAMRTFGFDRGAAVPALGITVLAEAALGAAVIAGSDTAALGAAALMLLFAATMVSALLRGRAGAPCACFGARSKVSPLAVGRNLVLAAAFAALPAVPDETPSIEGWLAIGLALALAAIAALAVAVLALAREVGMLRLRIGPAGALELPHEGPELGGHSPLIERFEPGSRSELALAVFTSEGCRVCRSLEPAVASLDHEPSLAVRSFEENAEVELWEALAIPGAPYAVALDLEGTVLAKGTFNNLAQLETIVGAAERRRAGAPA